MNTLEENISIFALAYPKEAVHLSYLDGRGISKEQLTPLFGKKLPAFSKEAVVLFGLGNGQDWDSLKKWLQQEASRKLFIFEPDLRIIKKYLAKKGSKELLLSNQASLHPVSLAAIDFVAWACYKTEITLIPHPGYKEKESFLKFSDALHFRILQKESLVEEYLDGSLSFFRNFYKNLSALATSKNAHSFYGKFKNIPGLICGAGPSLHKIFPLLKKIEEKALLLSGGSGTATLVLSAIRPHLAASIDPNPHQVSRIKIHEKEKIPHFFRLRIHYEALEILKGPKIYVPGAGGYEAIAEYFEAGLSIPHEEESVDEGYNVINFLLSLAVKMGLNPIILAGVDLSFQKGDLYSPLLEKGGALLDSEKKSQSDFADAVIEKKGTGTKKVATLYKWLYEADWIARFVKENPETEFFRIGEGLFIPGVKSISEEELKKHLNKSYPIEKKIKTILNKKESLPNPKKIKTLSKKLEKSLLACQHLLKELLILGEKAIQIQEPLDSKGALLEEQLSQEIGFSALLDGFNAVALALQGPRLRYLKIKQTYTSKTAIDLEKAALQNERLAFLLKTTAHNLMLLRWAQSSNK